MDSRSIGKERMTKPTVVPVMQDNQMSRSFTCQHIVGTINVFGQRCKIGREEAFQNHPIGMSFINFHIGGEQSKNLRVRQCGRSARCHYLLHGRFGRRNTMNRFFKRTHSTVQALTTKIKEEVFCVVLGQCKTLFFLSYILYSFNQYMLGSTLLSSASKKIKKIK